MILQAMGVRLVPGRMPGQAEALNIKVLDVIDGLGYCPWHGKISRRERRRGNFSADH